MLDLLQNVVIGETLDAQLVKYFDINVAIERFSKW